MTPRGGAEQPPPDRAVDAPTERLPIYEAVLSQWFEAGDTGSSKAVANGAAAPGGSPNGTANGAHSGAVNGNGNSNGHTNGHSVTEDTPVEIELERPEPAPEEPVQAAEPVAPEPDPEPVPAAVDAWQSPGDDGWQRARALLDTSADTMTTAGLPKRVPKAHLVPGSAAPREETAEQPAPPPLPPRTADAVRGRMSSFQQGVRRGRHALIDAYAGDQTGSDESRLDEEQE